MIREAGRAPAERSTTYERLHLYETEPVEPDRLDRVDDQEARRFGSYQQLDQARDLPLQRPIARSPPLRVGET